MAIRIPSIILILLLSLSPLSGARGQQWTFQPQDSRLEFIASYDGVPFTGEFERFDVELEFDPDQPGAGRLSVSVDIASVNTRNRDRDEVLAEPDWFDFAAYPEASYLASGFQATPGGRFSAAGELTLKGHAAVVPIEFEWRENGAEVSVDGVAVMSGEALVDRLLFAIGIGEWAEDELIGSQVEVSFHVVLR